MPRSRGARGLAIALSLAAASCLSQTDSIRERAREEMQLTEAELEDFMARPPHFDHHGLHELKLSDGNICIADSTKHDLKIISPDALYLRTIGSNGTELGQFHYPRGLAEGIITRTSIAVDGRPSTYTVPVLYVADYGNSRVQMLRLSDGEPVSSFGRQGAGESELDHPEGLFLHEQRLYVVDRGNHRILVLDHELRRVFSFGEYGVSNGQFDHPTHVSVYDNRLWVSHRDAAVRVQSFDLNGQWLETIRGSGGPG